MSAIITSDRFWEALVDAGIVSADEKVTRLVLDVRVGQVPVLHIERLGDERLLTLVPTLDGVKVRREGDSSRAEAAVREQDAGELDRGLMTVDDWRQRHGGVSPDDGRAGQ